MKNPAVLLLVLAGAGCSLFSKGMPPPSSPAVADAEVAARVSLALRQARIPEYQEIRIEAHEGVVTLRGRVSSAEAAEKAVHAASEAPGVKRVQSELHVEPGLPLPEPAARK